MAYLDELVPKEELAKKLRDLGVVEGKIEEYVEKFRTYLVLAMVDEYLYSLEEESKKNILAKVGLDSGEPTEEKLRALIAELSERLKNDARNELFSGLLKRAAERAAEKMKELVISEKNA